jgi:Ni2+-binding GTPase involved in maturation of urease and hydrogenase
MNASLSQQVTHKEYCHREMRGFKPRILLLGQKEQKEFEQLFIENLGCMPGFTAGNRAEFRGMKVYAVDDESYIGVAE